MLGVVNRQSEAKEQALLRRTTEELREGCVFVMLAKCTTNRKALFFRLIILTPKTLPQNLNNDKSADIEFCPLKMYQH